jgi:hypothetical protein
MQNPISTPIQSIILKSNLSTDDSDFDIELMKNNKFCQFERIELEESINNIFPTGALIIRDTSDILTYIAENEIKSIIVSMGDLDDTTSEKYEWSITSITYANNAVSEIDQTFVVIYFTNKLFQESQGKSFYDEIVYGTDSEGEVTATPTSLWDISYPFVTTPEHIIKTYGYRSVFSKPLFNKRDSDGNEITLKGCGINNNIKNNFEPKNAVLFRPKIADATRQEQYQTNIISYLNYIFTYAVSSPLGSNQLKPYYMFWTDFTNCLNYKFFDLRSDLKTDLYKFDLDPADPYHIQPYGVYDSPDVQRLLKDVDGEEIECKKIYVLVTNPATSIINKNYYYIRDSPSYMEIPSFGISGATTNPLNLVGSYLSDSGTGTLTTVTKYTENVAGGVTYSMRTMAIEDANLTYLPDGGFYGYVADFAQSNTKINTTDAVAAYESVKSHIEATPLGLRDSFQQPSPQTPLYPFNDNPYMWQFAYDLTRTHPNLVRAEDGGVVSVKEIDFYQELSDLLYSDGGDDITQTVITILLESLSLNKVLQAKYKAMGDKNNYDNYRRKQLEQTEKENFVANVLCCIGEDLAAKEDWFFAKITGFIPDNRKLRDGPAVEGPSIKLGAVADAWLYSWKKLEPGPLFVGLTAGITADVERFASYHSMMHGWTTSPCIGSTGMPDISFIEGNSGFDVMKHGGSFTGMATWAINLNERLNGQNDSIFTSVQVESSETGTDTKNYRGPGYFKDKITTNGQFAYKPIGFTGSLFTHSNALPDGPGYNKWESASHIVKMYKIRVNKLREMGCIPPAPNLGNEYMYYFIAENAVDGIC